MELFLRWPVPGEFERVELPPGKPSRPAVELGRGNTQTAGVENRACRNWPALRSGPHLLAGHVVSNDAGRVSISPTPRASHRKEPQIARRNRRCCSLDDGHGFFFRRGGLVEGASAQWPAAPIGVNPFLHGYVNGDSGLALHTCPKGGAFRAPPLTAPEGHFIRNAWITHPARRLRAFFLPKSPIPESSGQDRRQFALSFDVQSQAAPSLNTQDCVAARRFTWVEFENPGSSSEASGSSGIDYSATCRPVPGRNRRGDQATRGVFSCQASAPSPEPSHSRSPALLSSCQRSEFRPPCTRAS